MSANPTSTPVTRTPLPRVLWPLVFGNFVIGTGVMVVPGTLNEISSSLDISVAAAGQLISAAALTMCIGAPAFAAIVAGWDRRRLLALSMLWFAALHFACAWAPDFATLLVLRVLAVIPPAIFTPQTASCVGLLVPPQDRGRAITFVFLGWSIASVLGIPVCAFIGGTLGWRAAFVLVGVLSVLSAAWVWHTMPDDVKPPALSLSAWKQTFRSPAVMTCVAVTLLYSAGQFVQFAYMAPYYKYKLAITPGELSLLFMWFGAFGFLGNVLLSRSIDRLGADRAVMIAIALMAISLLVFPLGVNLALAAVVCVPWALGCFSSNSAQQARLVAIAPGLAAASVALNTSAMYAGQALGAAAGGWLILQWGMESLHWTGFIVMVASMGVSAAATRFGRREREVPAHHRQR